MREEREERLKRMYTAVVKKMKPESRCMSRRFVGLLIFADLSDIDCTHPPLRITFIINHSESE